MSRQTYHKKRIAVVFPERSEVLSTGNRGTAERLHAIFEGLGHSSELLPLRQASPFFRNLRFAGAASR